MTSIHAVVLLPTSVVSPVYKRSTLGSSKMLIVGTRHTEIQTKLLEKGESLSGLDTALNIACTFESKQAHVAVGPSFIFESC